MEKKKAMECGVWILKKLEDEILAWPNVSLHPHRFAGRDFRLLK